LYDRLAKSKDKKGLMQLSCRGQEIISATDAVKDPFVLEFLDIPESHRLIESKLEEALCRVTPKIKFSMKIDMVLGSNAAIFDHAQHIGTFFISNAIYHVKLKK
jgi:predicted nuclease of restriction endonuclease-like (RecB) superfamily